VSAILQVVFEDEDLLVVAKPAGLVSHPTKSGEMSSLIGRVRLHLGHGEGRLVNRLDRETSGVVLVAKSAAVASELGKILASAAARKVYDAILHGSVADDLTIDAALGRDEASPVAIKDRVREDGAPARTAIRVVKRFTRPEGAFTCVEVEPASGRKHQIRIHAAHAGHPIVGDKLYGADELIYLRFVAGEMTDGDRRQLILEHHALHAREMQFTWREREWRFEASPEDAFRQFVS
jgi:23S rRNA pseudouridine1911/1915/1917 synthase